MVNRLFANTPKLKCETSVIYCQIKPNKLIALKFNSHELQENLMNSIPGLYGYMIYHDWKKIPTWGFSVKGIGLLKRMVRLHELHEELLDLHNRNILLH